MKTLKSLFIVLLAVFSFASAEAQIRVRARIGGPRHRYGYHRQWHRWHHRPYHRHW